MALHTRCKTLEAQVAGLRLTGLWWASSGSCVAIENCEVAGIHPIVNVKPDVREFELVDGGKRYRGRYSVFFDEICWDDGDVWTRESLASVFDRVPPPAPGPCFSDPRTGVGPDKGPGTKVDSGPGTKADSDTCACRQAPYAPLGTDSRKTTVAPRHGKGRDKVAANHDRAQEVVAARNQFKKSATKAGPTQPVKAGPSPIISVQRLRARSAPQRQGGMRTSDARPTFAVDD
mmetsp:Transcript_82470/g.220400  ORF Transcript_82470/g.220400 Transcript_82470/m.220400 type:complete len:232 (+) Transcript_82470:65-760(+)